MEKLFANQLDVKVAMLGIQQREHAIFAPPIVTLVATHLVRLNAKPPVVNQDSLLDQAMENAIVNKIFQS